MNSLVLAQGVGTAFSDAAATGPFLIGLMAALAAGLVSFASPCVIPLVPGYVSYLSGISGADPENGEETHASRRSARARAGGAALLFVLGFTIIFVLGSASIFGIMSVLRLNQQVLTVGGGVIMILMGIAFMGFVPFLQRDTRMAPKKLATWVGAPVLGGVFALGWTPCLGPTLIGIMSIAAGTDGITAARGVVMIVAYCLGLGLPFILVALGSVSAMRSVDWLRKHSRQIQFAGGIMMVLVGLALVTGLWDIFISWVQARFITDTILFI